MKRSGGSGASSQVPNAVNANAYASAAADDSWSSPSHGTDDREALSGAIQQSAGVLEGDDSNLEGEEDLASIPMRSGEGSLRSMSAASAVGSGAEYGRRPLQPALRSSARYNTSAQQSDSTRGGFAEQWNDDQSLMSKSRVSFSESTKAASVGLPRSQTKAAARLRAMIALICLGLSLALAMIFSHGHTGRWITNRAIGIAPGTTSVKEGPTLQGVPGSIGQHPAYNGTFELPDLENMDIVLTAEMENYADWRIPFPASNRTELPVFWPIPRAGGTVVKRILGECLGLVEVSEEGADHFEPNLQVMENVRGSRYLNVDSTTMAGLQRALDLNVPASGLADVMFTTLIPQAAMIFTPANRARLFTIFRHPMERSMALYTAALANDPSLADMSIADYAMNYLPNNEMVRTLTGKGLAAELTEDDLFVAMEILRRKCVVGLVDYMAESMSRFHGYFGWHSLMVQGVTTCQTELLAPNMERIPAPAEGTEAHTFMMNQNRFDLRLYEYARYLFDVQGGSVIREAK